MAYENGMWMHTFEADADMSANQYEIVVISATGVGVASSQGEESHGVLQNKPDAANKAASVALTGVSKVYAGATITQGNKLTAGADGRAEVAASADWVVGIALAGGVDGDLIPMLICPSIGTALA